MQFVVTLEPDEVDGGFVADCPQLPGCMSHGDTRDEALTNIRGAILAVLEVWREKGWPLPAAQVHTVDINLPVTAN
jgi:predicted RNase H-like HicB family nuclease